MIPVRHLSARRVLRCGSCSSISYGQALPNLALSPQLIGPFALLDVVGAPPNRPLVRAAVIHPQTPSLRQPPNIRGPTLKSP